MNSLVNKITGLLHWIDTIEFAIPATLAMLLLLVGPPLAAAYLLRSQHYSAALVSGVLWLLAVIALIRDLRRLRFTWVNGSLIGAWFITTLILWWKLE